jgi:hypothetical protein
MKQSPMARRCRTIRGVRTRISAGNVGLTRNRISADLSRGRPVKVMTTSKSTSESSVGFPSA